MQGEFKGWVLGKTFGFIKGQSGERDIFALKKDSVDPSNMTAGSTVEFEIEETERGWAAKKIRLVEVAPPTSLHPEFPDRRMARLKFWVDNRGFGFLSPDDGSPDVFLSRNALKESAITYIQIGDKIEFSTYERDRGPVAGDVKLVGYARTGNAFQDEITIAKANWKAYLAELAEPEAWDYAETESANDFPILDSYLKYTFLRIHETTGITVSANGNFSCFNTGLVTKNQESIYAFLKKGDEGSRPWMLVDFVKESNRQFVDNFGGSVPPLAEYFEDPSELLFDRRLNLFINIDHILENIERFTEHLRENEYMARQLLNSAQSQTEKRVYRNYKTAIPQFFRNKGGEGRIQLLLPICLENPAKADLALTVAKNSDGTAYLSSTVLTLDMAYCNARLLARPDTEWLQP